MTGLDHKVDFALVFTVRHANPNGDPLYENMPRTTSDGYGEISDVCLKRKIRNRLLEQGENIFVQSDDNCKDGCKSLRDRAEKVLGKDVLKSREKLKENACKTWIDVRAFGQVFAFGNKNQKGENDDKDVSVGVRGPVTIQYAFSKDPVNVTSLQITKSVSGEGDGTKKGPDTMGMKHSVDFGLYVTYGSINPQLAELTGFSNEDALKIKNALLHIFDNDASSARPEGSMEVVGLYWWEHKSKLGEYPAAKVHRSLKIERKADLDGEPKRFEDYTISCEDLPGLKREDFTA